MQKRILSGLLAFIVALTIVNIPAYAATTTGSPFTSGKYTHASRFDDMKIHNGIDVSEWDEKIDWEKAADSGVEFAMVRVGYSSVYYRSLHKYTDDYYLRNLKEADKYGVKIGIYYFSQAKTAAEAKEEANYLVKKLKGYNISLPVVIDFEFGSGYRINVTKSKGSAGITSICKAFCTVVKNAGYTPMVYANYDTLRYWMNPSAFRSSGIEIWCAQYNSKCQLTGNYSMWQYTESGKVPGISNAADCNFLYGHDDIFADCLPSKVLKARATDTTLSSIKLRWNASSNADGYYIYRSESYDGTYSKVAAVTGRSYIDKNLEPGKEYYYRVAAYNGNGRGKKSARISQYTVSKLDRYGKTLASVNVRKHAGTSYDKLSKLTEGKTVAIYGETKDSEGNTWYRIKSGYISGSKVTTWKRGNLVKGTNLRSEASSESEKVAYIKKGTRVTVTGEKEAGSATWYRVKYTAESEVYRGWLLAERIA